MIAFVLLIGCESTVIYTSETTPKKPRETHTRSAQRPQSNQTTNTRVEGRDGGYMVASWYGNYYHGKQTASGEIFNMYDFTAAHRTLPFGTRLRLINPTNNREVEVRINDRGPVPLERDIDVSYKVAEELDFVSAGLSRLKVIYLDEK
jgi:rare lipoprotein A